MRSRTAPKRAAHPAAETPAEVIRRPNVAEIYMGIEADA